METFWWLDIVYFFVQTFIILISILILIGFIASLVGRSKEEFQIEITNVNKKYQKFKRTLDKNLHSPKDFKKILKSYKKIKSPDPKKPNVFVLEFSGDIQASANKQFREEVTACLLVAQKSDQVVVKVESPGGMVHGYGLATSQLHRIREQGIPLVVCVDQIAASGGYMMACVANKILAAPFSIIGSIGVVGSLPNFNRILKKNDIDYLEVTAGKHKRTLTPFGEITDEGMKKYKEQIQDVYELFKKHIKSQREKVDMDQVATGEYWYGQRAQELHLVDELGTSDDYLLNLSKTHNILEVHYPKKKTLRDKLSQGLGSLLPSSPLSLLRSFTG